MRTIFLLLIFFTSKLYCQELEQQHRPVVDEFITAVKSKNFSSNIAVLVSYPLKREYPLHSIDDEKQFGYECEIIFDAKLRDLIIKSTYKDWSAVGWRGIMFNNGLVWLDYDGKVIAVNYQSHNEKKKRGELIKSIKQNRYPSVNTFSEPITEFSTNKHFICIDKMADGTYRYITWPAASKISNKPSLVITGGKIEIQGSGGNHSYIFKNGDYTYECQIIILGEDDGPLGYLKVYKKDKEILNESIIAIGK